jgi:hypothetical protein
MFLVSTASIQALGHTQHTIQCVPGGGVKPGCEADHSSLSIAEVKNGAAIPPLPHHAMKTCCKTAVTCASSCSVTRCVISIHVKPARGDPPAWRLGVGFSLDIRIWHVAKRHEKMLTNSLYPTKRRRKVVRTWQHSTENNIWISWRGRSRLRLSVSLHRSSCSW